MDIAPTEDTPGGSEAAREIPASVSPFSIFSQVPSTTPPSRRLPSPGTSKNPVTRPVQSSHWVPDDMASGCYLCGKEFNVVRRRHHCRTCGRVCCDACSSKRINDKRTCASCWDRIGRKLSGLSRNMNGREETATRERDRKSVLFELLEDERFNRRFVVEDGRSVSYSVAGVPDGLPVFLFLGLDSHRYTAVLFEDVARRQGLQVICIDRPGRGKSDPLPPPPQLEGGGQAGDVREAMSRAIEASVVDTIKQMCVKLRIDKAGLLGQSLGALFALGCAKDEGLKDVLGDTTVCLVSPWVPLAAPGRHYDSTTGSKGWLQTASSILALASNAGITGGGAMKHVGDMEHGSSGANDKERVYLQAPYTQDLFKHLSDLKEGKEAVKNELCIALRNNGEEDAKKSFEAILHTVHIWHGKADMLISYDAMRWLERQLPSCTTTVVAEATHALMYDKDEMEEVFACLHKSISDARSTARHTARRIGNQLVSIFSQGDHSSISPGSASTAKDVKKGSTGTEKDDDQEGIPSTTTTGRPKLTDVLLKTFPSSKKSVESEVPSAGTPSAYESVVGSVSGHGSSGHGQGSDHGQGGSNSRHGSEFSPRCIPEESGAPLSHEGSGMFVGFRKIGHALSEAFGSEHGSVGSTHGDTEGRSGAMAPPPPPRPPLSKKASTGSLGSRGVEPTYPSEEEGGAPSGNFVRTFERALSALSIGSNGSGHGSVQGSVHGSMQDSAHGNGGGGGGAVAGGGSGASRRPSGGLLPWHEYSNDTHWTLPAVGVATPGNMSSPATLGTPRAVSAANLAPPRNLRAFTSDGFRRGWRSLSNVTAGTPRALSSAAARCSKSFFGVGASSGEVPFSTPGSTAAGYEAAMANWPAGKVPGNPAWDEWSVEKKLFAHIVTAFCLALIIATW